MKFFIIESFYSTVVLHQNGVESRQLLISDFKFTLAMSLGCCCHPVYPPTHPPINKAMYRDSTLPKNVWWIFNEENRFFILTFTDFSKKIHKTNLTNRECFPSQSTTTIVSLLYVIDSWLPERRLTALLTACANKYVYLCLTFVRGKYFLPW